MKLLLLLPFLLGLVSPAIAHNPMNTNCPEGTSKSCIKDPLTGAKNCVCIPDGVLN